MPLQGDVYKRQPSNTLYRLLCFDRNAILHGQVWRLVSFAALSLQSYDYLWAIVAVIFYVQLRCV